MIDEKCKRFSLRWNRFAFVNWVKKEELLQCVKKTSKEVIKINFLKATFAKLSVSTFIYDHLFLVHVCKKN